MTVNVLENWPELLGMASSIAGIVGMVVALQGSRSVRLGIGWFLTLLGLLGVTSAVVSLVSQRAPVPSHDGVALGIVIASGVLLGSAGVVIVIRTRTADHQTLAAIAEIMHSSTDPADVARRVDKPIELSVVKGRPVMVRRVRIRSLSRRPPSKLVVVTGSAGSGKTVALRAIVATICVRAVHRPRWLALYVEVRKESLPDGPIDEVAIRKLLAASVQGQEEKLAAYLDRPRSRPRWLFVFDLGDELTADQTELCIRAVHGFMRDRVDRAIVATRGGEGESSLVAMAPLTRRQQRLLLNATTRAHPKVLRRLWYDPQLEDIAGNPLLLSLLGRWLISDELPRTRHEILSGIVTTLLGHDSVITAASRLAYSLMDGPATVAPDDSVIDVLVGRGLGRTGAAGFRFTHPTIQHHLAGQYLCQNAATTDVATLVDRHHWHPVLIAGLHRGEGALREMVVEAVRIRLAADVASVPHLISSADMLGDGGTLPAPGTFTWPQGTVTLLTLLEQGLVHESPDHRTTPVLPEIDTLVLTAVATGAGKERKDAVDLLSLASREVATAVAEYVTNIEGDTDLAERLTVPVAARPDVYQALSVTGQVRVLRLVVDNHLVNRVLYGFGQVDSLPGSLPGRMRSMLRISQVAATMLVVAMIGWILRVPQPLPLILGSLIAAIATGFLVDSGTLHVVGLSRFGRLCGIGMAAVISLLATLGSFSAALSAVGELVTGQIVAAVFSFFLFWLYTWTPAMLLYAASTPAEHLPRLLWAPQLRIHDSPASRTIIEQITNALQRVHANLFRRLSFALALAAFIFLIFLAQLPLSKEIRDNLGSALVFGMVVTGWIAIRPESAKSRPKPGSENLLVGGGLDPLHAFRTEGASDPLSTGLQLLSKNVDTLRAAEPLLSNIDSVLEFIKETLPRQMDAPIKRRLWMLMPPEQVPGFHALLEEYDNKNPGRLITHAYSPKYRSTINELRIRAHSTVKGL